MPRRSSQPAAAPAPSRGFSRDFGEDFASTLPDLADETPAPRRRGKNSGYRLRLNGRALQVPKTTWGRILSAIAFLILASAAAYLAVRSFFLHDPRFTVASSASIQTIGNTHLSRAQLLSVFGEDVERNIFRIPLSQRRAELESLPWVEHATVMRLLPNHIRIAITERTPVAFVRQGSQIGMVDANGVLLDIPPDAPVDPHYSFPVVTGINASDPLSTRAARMRVYSYFTSDLDSTGDHISEKLSEVDLSDPEDVKALIPEVSGGITTDLLVHFGESDFLARYRKFEAHLQEWLTDHPKLASVDMRYEHQAGDAARRNQRLRRAGCASSASGTESGAHGELRNRQLAPCYQVVRLAKNCREAIRRHQTYSREARRPSSNTAVAHGRRQAA